MKHFYFIENETGEEFIVGADTLSKAWVIARGIESEIGLVYWWNTSLSFKYEMTDEEAEASGLDEY